MMIHLLKASLSLAAIGLGLASNFGAVAQTSPYAGEQQRAIKALDAREVSALRQGQGMGFAKAAEPLQLTTEQRAATRRLMDEHKARAREYGERLVEAEAALDRLFADRQATPERVAQATQRIASLSAQLRAEHLNTHLAQTALMSPAQTLRYAELRGYATAAPAGQGSAHKHRH
jgi:hypothetical protein